MPPHQSPGTALPWTLGHPQTSPDKAGQREGRQKQAAGQGGCWALTLQRHPRRSQGRAPGSSSQMQAFCPPAADRWPLAGVPGAHGASSHQHSGPFCAPRPGTIWTAYSYHLPKETKCHRVTVPIATGEVLVIALHHLSTPNSRTFHRTRRLTAAHLLPSQVPRALSLTSPTHW